MEPVYRGISEYKAAKAKIDIMDKKTIEIIDVFDLNSIRFCKENVMK